MTFTNLRYLLVKLFINDKMSQTYFKAIFRTRIIRILPSEIKYVLYDVRSHYDCHSRCQQSMYEKRTK